MDILLPLLAFLCILSLLFLFVLLPAWWKFWYWAKKKWLKFRNVD